jgi:hypothetical protein
MEGGHKPAHPGTDNKVIAIYDAHGRVLYHTPASAAFEESKRHAENILASDSYATSRSRGKMRPHQHAKPRNIVSHCLNDLFDLIGAEENPTYQALSS